MYPIKQNALIKRKRQRPLSLTCGAVKRGELVRAEAVREVTLTVACKWVGLDGGRDRVGLCPPSESLPWLLGGVGGMCRVSTTAGEKQEGEE